MPEPEISCPGPAGEYIDLKSVSGGGMDFTYTSAAGAPLFGWSMSHSQALTLAARILGHLGYCEIRLRGDGTVASAS
jgi:hypothetical protein